MAIFLKWNSLAVLKTFKGNNISFFTLCGGNMVINSHCCSRHSSHVLALLRFVKYLFFIQSFIIQSCSNHWSQSRHNAVNYVLFTCMLLLLSRLTYCHAHFLYTRKSVWLVGHGTKNIIEFVVLYFDQWGLNIYKMTKKGTIFALCISSCSFNTIPYRTIFATCLP